MITQLMNDRVRTASQLSRLLKVTPLWQFWATTLPFPRQRWMPVWHHGRMQESISGTLSVTGPEYTMRVKSGVRHSLCQKELNVSQSSLPSYRRRLSIQDITPRSWGSLCICRK